MSDGIDQAIDRAFEPIASAMVDIVFVSINIGGTELPLIVAWLVAKQLCLSQSLAT
jgi:alanine or glycine:cation symporter, AGCS family